MIVDGPEEQLRVLPDERPANGVGGKFIPLLFRFL